MGTVGTVLVHVIGDELVPVTYYRKPDFRHFVIVKQISYKICYQSRKEYKPKNSAGGIPVATFPEILCVGFYFPGFWYPPLIELIFMLVFIAINKYIFHFQPARGNV